jgi:hypothetical protein
MVDTTDIGERIETRDDLGPENSDAARWAYWMGQEKIAEKEERKWIKQGREIVKRYRDERPESIQSTHRFNIFWSNVETLKPALYARTPKPDVRRTFGDDDPVGLFAAELLQRCLEYSCDAHDKHFDSVMEAVVEDRLLPGRAVARVLYVPHYGDPIETPADVGIEAGDTYQAEDQAGADVASPGDEGKTDEQAEPDREVVFEEVTASYVFWEDYREGPARQWNEVPWVRYRAHMTRDQIVARFGKSKGKRVNLDVVPKGTPDDSPKEGVPADLFKKAAIYEYWDRERKQAVWLAPSTPDLILDEQDDPLRLPGFFPNPDPLLANKTNDKRIPVPDYVQYQDQARELDRLTSRIDKLQGALKVSGIYPGEEKAELQQLIDEGTENRLIPVHDWQRVADKGGLQGMIQWMPIKEIAETLIQLYGARDRTKQILYELTGMSDILRGQTSPIETKGAQDLKANFATRRISPKQKKVADFATNLIKLKGAVIAEHFSPKTISMITGFPQSEFIKIPPLPPAPPQMIPGASPQGPQAVPQAGAPVPGSGAAPSPAPAAAQPGTALVPMQQMVPNPAFQQWMQMRAAIQQAMQKNQQAQQKFDDAVALIKQDGVHGFRIDIEADSTIAPDEEAQKQSHVEFLQGFVPFLTQIVPFCQGNAAAAALGEQLTLFAMRPFKVARALEDNVTKFFEALKGMPPPQPSGGKAGSGPDTPEALAQRQNDTQSRERIAQQQNAVKLAQLNSNERIKTAEIEMDAKMHHDKLAADISKEADVRAFRDVRAGAIQAKEASLLQ